MNSNSVKRTMRIVAIVLPMIAMSLIFTLFGRSAFPGGQLYNYFDTGEIGYVLVGPFFLLISLAMPVGFIVMKLIFIIDNIFFKTEVKNWLDGKK